jgi:UDP-N-acetylglucosamine:LPS N-acetylglucosamine transferase
MSEPDRRDRPRHVYLVGSSGGHLAQLLALRPWWSSWRRTWVTFDTQDAVSLLREEREEEVHWAFSPTTRSLPNLARNLALAVRLLRDDRPDLVVSAGAGVALPFFAFARLLRIPTAYIEVYDRIDTPTLTARLCRPFTTLSCVQWEEQRSFSPKAHVIGPLL